MSDTGDFCGKHSVYINADGICPDCVKEEKQDNELSKKYVENIDELSKKIDEARHSESKLYGKMGKEILSLKTDYDSLQTKYNEAVKALKAAHFVANINGGFREKDKALGKIFDILDTILQKHKS